MRATYITHVEYKKITKTAVQYKDYYGEIVEDTMGCTTVLMELCDGGYRRFTRKQITVIEKVQSNEEYDDARFR